MPTYTGWLADLGYDVHLVDVVPLHVEQAKEIAGAGSSFSAVVDRVTALLPRPSAGSPRSPTGS